MTARPRPGRFSAREDGGFGACEEGGATAFGLVVIGLLLLLAGVAIDVANLYRYKTLLQLAADSAAQAGVVTLARGGRATDAHSAAKAMVETNMPQARFGQVVTNSTREVQVLHYDAATGTLVKVSDAAPANAVLVRLQRSAAAGNPVPTFLMGVAGSDAWSLAASSVATLTPTQRCGNAEGIVARGAIDLGPAPVFDSDFCLHSQSSLTLPVDTRVADQLRVSLPNPSDCAGVCKPDTPVTTLGPPIVPVALNLVMPGAQDHVARLAAGFVDPQITLPEEVAFFASHPLAGDPEALREVGVRADDARPGDVLQMTPLQFSQMRERPSGLVYAVRCNTTPNDRRPLWERTLTLTGSEGAPTLQGLVLVTDCAIELDAFVRIEGVLILMTGPLGAQISALKETALGATPGEETPGEETLGGQTPGGQTPGEEMAGGETVLPKATLAREATLGGGGDAACDAVRRVRLMATGDLVLPAGLARGNLSVVAGGDIWLAADPDHDRTRHSGLILHAGGRVTATGNHSFARCTTEARTDPLMPAMQVIAHVMPSLKAVLAPPLQAPPQTLPKADMPGQTVERLPMKGTLLPES